MRKSPSRASSLRPEPDLSMTSPTAAGCAASAASSPSSRPSRGEPAYGSSEPGSPSAWTSGSARTVAGSGWILSNAAAADPQRPRRSSAKPAISSSNTAGRSMSAITASPSMYGGTENHGSLVRPASQMRLGIAGRKDALSRPTRNRTTILAAASLGDAASVPSATLSSCFGGTRPARCK